MKKFYSLAIAVLAMSLTANATDLFNGSKEFTLGTKKVENSTIKHAPARHVESAQAPEKFIGDFIQTATEYFGGETFVYPTNEVSITLNDEGYAFGNFLGTLGVDGVTAVYDADQEAFIVDCLLPVASSQSYGPLGLIGFTSEDNSYSEVEELVFSIDEKGALYLSNADEIDLMILEGDYSGYTLYPAVSDVVFYRANATMSNVIANMQTCEPAGESSYPVYVEIEDVEDETFDAVGFVSNYAQLGTVEFAIAGNEIVFDQSPIDYYGSSYKPLTVFLGAQNTNGAFAFYSTYGPEGTINDDRTEINLDMWTVLLQSTSGSYYYVDENLYTLSSVITITKDPSSIKEISSDASIAPVEYYNLQGMRITDPTAGQIVIVKEGSKVSKRIVK